MKNIGWIQIVRNKNGVSIAANPHGESTVQAGEATVIQFKPFDDDMARNNSFSHPVGHILKEIAPMLREMDAVYVEENTPPVDQDAIAAQEPEA